MSFPLSNETLPQQVRLAVGSHQAGLRLDIFLAVSQPMADCSRSMLQGLIRNGLVLVNGRPQKAGYRLQGNEAIEITVPVPVATDLVPEAVPFAVLFEDEDLLVLSKPPGIVVHPAAGHHTGTLVHGLLHHCDNLSGISGELRPGIVHRLDQDTSGVLVAAKNDRCHRALVEQFKGRQVEKFYRAILDGRPARPEGRINLPIGRHPVDRKKMAVVAQNGREAVTCWRVLEEFPSPFTFVELRLETGRTHQIRVHMAAQGNPVAGDLLYGRKRPEYGRLGIVRQCLHAASLAFQHPTTGQFMRFEASLWPDMVQILEALRRG